MNPIKEGGRINCCKHTFCLDCITKWAEVSTIGVFLMNRGQIIVPLAVRSSVILLHAKYSKMKKNFIIRIPLIKSCYSNCAVIVERSWNPFLQGEWLYLVFALLPGVVESGCVTNWISRYLRTLAVLHFCPAAIRKGDMYHVD